VIKLENVPYPENARDGFPTTDFFLFFLFSLEIFDSPSSPCVPVCSLGCFTLWFFGDFLAGFLLGFLNVF
jgi:hypothetical protein